jgi:serine/threonine protein kinase
MHKAPLTEPKQIEHVVNERKILEAANHIFCVRLVQSFQDAKKLYLLQEWIAGKQ